MKHCCRHIQIIILALLLTAQPFAAATAADGNVEQNRSVDLMTLRTLRLDAGIVCPLEGSSIVVIIYT